MKQQIIQFLSRYRLLLGLLVFAGLLGYGLLRLQPISNPQPDPDYLSAQQPNAAADSIRVKDSLRQEIDKLVGTPVNVKPSTLGRPDPFNP